MELGTAGVIQVIEQIGQRLLIVQRKTHSHLEIGASVDVPQRLQAAHDFSAMLG
jgi:hypothetical protein